MLPISSDASPQPVQPLEKDCLQSSVFDSLRSALKCFEKFICALKRETSQISLDMARQANVGWWEVR
jgi:hypothetical protein